MTERRGGIDPFVHDDAAYVLGALSESERVAYEAHLAGCAACRQSVARLRALPELLGRVPLDVALSLPAADGPRHPDVDPELDVNLRQPPDSLLDDVLERVRATDRRRAGRRLLAVAAAGLAAAAVVIAIAVLPGDEPAPTDPAAQAIELVALRPGPMGVTAELTGVPWGTRIDLTCTYAEGPSSPYAPASSYSLVVRDVQGHDEQVATWGAVPGREVTVQAATALRLGAITELEVRTADGTPVLRAQP